jgi:hypothetical protein
MWSVIVSIGILAIDYAWNHWINPSPVKKPDNEFQLPTTEAGAVYPLIYGRCRIRQPVLVWCDTPVVESGLNDSDGNALFYQYGMSMHYVLGLPFLDGEQHIHNLWAGDARADQNNDIGNGSYGATTIHGLADLVGDGNVEDLPPSGRGESVHIQQNPNDATSIVVFGCAVEFLNGNSNQLLIESTTPFTPLTRLAQHMTETVPVAGQPFNSLYGTINPQYIGSYRGALSAFLFGHFGGLHCLVGQTPQVPAVSFEVSSYPKSTDYFYPSQGAYRKIGNDANPADVIYDVLTGIFGKLGLDPSLIDMESFQLAAYTLYTENHGYSRVIEDTRSGTDILQEILVQIAGSLYEDPTMGKFKLKLIRNDYDPTTVPVIDRSNCIQLTNFVSGGWSGLPNKLRLTYTNAQDDYRDGSVTAQNLANAVDQDGLIHEQAISMPGITNGTLALIVAERELAMRSRPTIAFTAIVDGSFWRARPGDVFKVNYSKPDIAGLMFRVMSVDLGTLTDGKIQLGLVQDPFYVWRNRPPVNTGFGGHPVDTSGLASGG